MNMLMEQGVKCVILTSGTLAPLKPLISELEINVGVQLENPHIVKGDQVCVKILSNGPDGTMLNCSYQNRSNPEYIKSLGMTINNLARIIPDGLLIFFPSYPIMEKCKTVWQEDGMWSSISSVKVINVEPKNKVAFAESMNNYYSAIKDPNSKGAIFMGVCRGKVSEGLDFADANGRAVIIIGLPYAPLKDPRVVLKKRYQDVCRARNTEYIGGNDWYSLDATKAVNQAIGRVIRHKSDYGAIILLDSRFNNPRIINQMSLWLRGHVKNITKYGEIIRDLRKFYTDAKKEYPLVERPSLPAPSSFEALDKHKNENADSRSPYFDFSKSQATASVTTEEISQGIKRARNENVKRTKFSKEKFLSKDEEEISIVSKTDVAEYLIMVKKTLNVKDYTSFVAGLKEYKDCRDFYKFCDTLDSIFLHNYRSRFIIIGLERFMSDEHKSNFNNYWERMK